MSSPFDPRNMAVSDAMSYLADLLRRGQAARYGYDLSVDQVVHQLVTQTGQDDHAALLSVSRVFYDAAWELCVRGIVRPGVTHYQAHAVDAGGFSLTGFGRAWLKEQPTDPIIVTDPNRLSALFNAVRQRFGAGYYQRAMEAVRCFSAHAFLGTCVMCGAAAESILLALAIEKTGDEDAVLKTYGSAQGRSRVENMLLGPADVRTKAEFAGFLGLLKDWRDESAHGTATPISADEAATALDLLARFGIYADREWDRLTGAIP